MPKSAQSWMIIAEAFRHSITPQCLGLALMGVLAMTLGWQLTGKLLLAAHSTDQSVRTRKFHDIVSAWPGRGSSEDGIDNFTPKFLRDVVGSIKSHYASPPIDPIFGVQLRVMEPFRRLFTNNQSWSSLSYYLLGGLITLAIWAFYGIAITRTSVIKCGLQQPISIREALQFGGQRGLAVFTAVTLPLVGIAMLAFPFVVLGWAMNLDVGIVVAGAVWVGVLLSGCFMAGLSLGMLAGWPLMWGAIATEDSDAFDAISRSYAYTFQRPLHYLFYACIASFIALLGWLLVWWFSEAVIHMSYWSVQFGCGADRVEALRSHVDARQPVDGLSNMMSTGVALIRIGVGLVRCVASAYSFSVFWCFAGAIYLLLRRDTDQTELDDILFEQHRVAETHGTQRPETTLPKGKLQDSGTATE